jgi:predicted esterase YcpF (UPF0227 family)
MILYIHGFNSSHHSEKAQEVRRWLQAQGREHEWVCPDLPHHPAEAVALLSDIIQTAETPPKLVGSSLGGFYATHLVAKFGVKAVLVNPVVRAGQLLRQLAGTEQHFWYKDERYLFTRQHVEELEALDQLTPAYPENILVMLETGDKTLDWQDATAYYRHAHQLIFRGGNHGFTRFRDVLELIGNF